VKDSAWFLWKSWSYLGCDSGTGRWRARRRYVRGIWPAWRRFRAACKRDRAMGWSMGPARYIDHRGVVLDDNIVITPSDSAPTEPAMPPSRREQL
jgi:hypothetical protein